MVFKPRGAEVKKALEAEKPKKRGSKVAD